MGDLVNLPGQIVTVIVPMQERVANTIARHAEAQGKQKTTWLAEAVALKEFVDGALARGEIMLMKKPNGDYSRIEFR